MKYISLLCLIVICLYQGELKAQCNNTLVDKAIIKSGSSAVYLRDFKVKFDASDHKKSIPTAKYPILLSKGTTYRFNVCNAEEFEGKVILELYLKDQLIKSTFDTQLSTDHQQFDFKCSKAATYDVAMYFEEGKPGCAVGIISMLTEKGAEIESDDQELDILYALADNPVTIYDDSEDQFYPIEVSIDNGYITKADATSYIIHPQEPGAALLTIRILNRNGTERDLKQKRYAVLALDKPYASVRGIQEGKIGRQELKRSGRLDLKLSTGMKCDHRIISFTLSDRDDLISGITSTSNKLSRSQKKWIDSLPAGTKVYIKNIKVRTSDQVVMDIAPLDFVIE